MSTTLGAFRTTVRTELGDTSVGAYVWSDAQLNGFINDALDQLTIEFPITNFHSFPAINGIRDYVPVWPGTGAIPPGPQGIYSLEYPQGVIIPPGEANDAYNGFSTGGGVLSRSYDQCWQAFREAFETIRIRFRYPLTDTQIIYVTYHKQYSHPASDAATLEVSTPNELPLRWWTCYRAFTWLDEQRGKRTGTNTAGRRGSAGLYETMYKSSVKALRQGQGPVTTFLNLR